MAKEQRLAIAPILHVLITWDSASNNSNNKVLALCELE